LVVGPKARYSGLRLTPLRPSRLLWIDECGLSPGQSDASNRRTKQLHGLPPLALARINTGSSAKPKSRERMRLAPQSVCHTERLDAHLSPPRCFVPTSIQFAMMSAQWDRELITHLSSKCPALCKSEVVRIGRTPAADQARLSRDEFHMLSIADSTRLRSGRTAFFDPIDSGSSGRKGCCELAY
jgi:hypothetical protein